MTFKKKLPILVFFMLVDKKFFFVFIFKQKLCNIFLLLNLLITHTYGSA